MSETRCYDFESGLQLAVYPGLLTQVKVGADFYVGQTRYVVAETKSEPDVEVLRVILKRETK